MIKHLLLATTLLAAPFATPTPGAVTNGTPATPPLPAAPMVTVDIATVTGDACSATNVTVTVAPDSSQFSVAYPDSVPATAADTSEPRYSSTCAITVRVNPPRGYTYGITQAYSLGSASLSPGTTARIRSSLHIAGNATEIAGTHFLEGPFVGDWHFWDDIESGWDWAPCGNADLMIEREIALTAGTADPGTSDSLSTVPTAGGPGGVYLLGWRSCGQPQAQPRP